VSFNENLAERKTTWPQGRVGAVVELSPIFYEWPVTPITQLIREATLVKRTLTGFYDRFVTFSRNNDKYHFFLDVRLFGAHP
jgi:hypothetical protein